MIFDLRDLVSRVRRSRARKNRLRDLHRRLAREAGPEQVSAEELRLARDLRRMREVISAKFGRVEACRTCARGHPPPAGRWPGGHCCSGDSVVFSDEELGALKLSGTTKATLEAAREDDAGCVFRGSTGCVLRPSDRPNLCARYICTSLDLELERRGSRREIRQLSTELKKTFDAFVAIRASRTERTEQTREREEQQAIVSSKAPSLGHDPIVPPCDPRVAIMGRVERSRSGPLRFGYPGVTVRIKFEGAALRMRVASTTGDNYLAILVDGGRPAPLRLSKGTHDVDLCSRLPFGIHSVDIVHQTETWHGLVSLYGFYPGKGSLLAPDPWPGRRLLVVGDSVTAGESVNREACPRKGPAWWDAYASYGMLLSRSLDAQVHLVAYGGRGLIRDWQGNANVLNAPQLFDLAVADDIGPSPWDHRDYPPDAIVISIGTNEFNLYLGELPDRNVFIEAYLAFLHHVRDVHPTAHIFLTDGAMVNDEADPDRNPKTTLFEYLSETVRRCCDPRVHLAPSRHFPGDDRDAHPTRAQHDLIAADLGPLIAKTLGW